MRLLLLLALCPAAALADCPPGPDIAAEAAPLIRALPQAGGERAARLIMDDLWQLWMRAPDPRAQEFLDRGMDRRAAYDLRAAYDAFDQLVGYCPGWAEGWNQRAFALFQMQDFEGALPDLDRALELSPAHVGALSGRAMTLLALGRVEEGQQALRDALAVNPWLAERRLLIEPPGVDL
ncbi:tetratricopeptide repeat protein [Wenxinia saemankumensis]|uniref:Tetratricopeptide repeat-containing protein n=1 Tax=Wenxinia saemankumensis TaxID=1447782 RepID=A0A1M6CP06_9RHOB|nr:tetratricopeptide repeat protein [Wenxinia saemankumensis]SHI62737.1 Tetratricopeptide repeat-containing protein [Wenxinia saemankumensis]